MPLTEKEAAALERLEAEKNRRIEDKIQSGAAVRVPLVVVVGAGPADVVKARKRKLEQLREAGEKREIYFDETVIATGVPRPGRDDGYTLPEMPEPPAPSICDRRSVGGAPPFAVSDDMRSALPQEKAIADKEANMSREIERADPVVRRIWVQTEQPSDRNPGGAIVEGFYRVEDGMLKVADQQGHLLDALTVNPGDDVEATARRILREKRASSFFNPIPYPRRSML
jgi:hypothetical protein